MERDQLQCTSCSLGWDPVQVDLTQKLAEIKLSMREVCGSG